MGNQKNIFKDTMILGFAVFSMYFGAGNVIFPPYLGLISSSDYELSFISYFVADIGFATIAMFALLKVGGNIDNLIYKIGKLSGTLLMASIILCIGPLIALPRTGATTYEMMVVPIFGSSLTNSILTSIIYYGLIMFVTFNPVSMIKILGKILTPILFISLLALIIRGVLFPIGEIAENQNTDSLFFNGLILGYQTLDVLAALAFGIIILKIVRSQGYTDDKTIFKMVGFASILAALGIMIVYFGLSYLGATTSNIYLEDVEKAVLLNSIINHLFGDYGNVVLGIVIFLACFTTGAALTSVTSEYFSKISGDKISYKQLVVIVTLYSIVVTNVGLEQIINFAVPILTVVYPIAIILVVLAFFDKYINNDNVYKMAALGAVIYSLLDVFTKNMEEINTILQTLPLAKEGLGWFLPAFVFGVVGYFIKSKKANTIK